MKLLLRLLVASVMLTATGFAQELEPGAARHQPATDSKVSTEQTVATGPRQRRAPVVLPKALPRLNPSLGEIARRVRAAHAEAPKAQVVVADDAPPQK
ncbi:MAG: hypothetical protein ACRD23_14215 [Terriglobales bacterium]